MKASDLIRGQRLQSVSPEETLSLAAQQMAWGGFRHLPVELDGRLVGILSERDVLARRAGLSTKVAMAMTSHPKVASPEDDVTEIESRLLSSKIDCLPVVDRGKLLGIVTTSDLLSAHVRRAGGETNGQQLARDFMTPEPAHVHEGAWLLEAVGQMVDRGIRHLPVVDKELRVIGMLSDQDVRALVGNPLAIVNDDRVKQQILDLQVVDAMNRSPSTVPQDAPIGQVIDLFLRERMGAVAVVGAGDRLVGVISYLDVLRELRRRLS